MAALPESRPEIFRPRRQGTERPAAEMTPFERDIQTMYDALARLSRSRPTYPSGIDPDEASLRIPPFPREPEPLHIEVLSESLFEVVSITRLDITNGATVDISYNHTRYANKFKSEYHSFDIAWEVAAPAEIARIHLEPALDALRRTPEAIGLTPDGQEQYHPTLIMKRLEFYHGDGWLVESFEEYADPARQEEAYRSDEVYEAIMQQPVQQHIKIFNDLISVVEASK